jgi:hypothetical protein
VNRKSIAISLILTGYPTIYFFRDGIGIAPGNFYFTGISLIAFSILLIDINILKYKFNLFRNEVGKLFLIFTIISIFYLILSDYENKLTDFMYYGFYITFIFLLLNTDDSKLKNIYISFFIISIVNSVLYLYFYNKYFSYYRELGERAYIGFDEEGGNPGIYGICAYYGLISSIFMFALYGYKKYYLLVLFSLGIIMNMLVVLLTQVRAVILSMVIALSIYLLKKVFSLYLLKKVFSFRKIDTKINIKKIFTTILFFIFLLTIFYFFYIRNRQIIISYSDSFIDYTRGAYENISGGRGGDMSSIQRIDSFNMFLEEIRLEPESYIFGKGYRNLYLDIPIIQSFRDIGILGGFIFVAIHFVIIRNIYLWLIRAKSISVETQFFLYLYPLYFVMLFTHGQPYDVPLSLFTIAIARIFDIDYSNKVKN